MIPCKACGCARTPSTSSMKDCSVPSDLPKAFGPDLVYSVRTEGHAETADGHPLRRMPSAVTVVRSSIVGPDRSTVVAESVRYVPEYQLEEQEGSSNRGPGRSEITEEERRILKALGDYLVECGYQKAGFYRKETRR